MVVAGTEKAVLMVESEAKELPEAVMLGAVMFAHQAMQIVIQTIQALAEEAGKPAWDWQPSTMNADLEKRVAELAQADIISSLSNS